MIKNILKVLSKTALTSFAMMFFFIYTSSYSQVYNFTNCGASGVNGPNQTQANSFYSNTNLSGQITVTGNGIQEWTVPATGTYEITAAGASGGFVPSAVGGQGRVITSEVELTAGDVIQILVGQEGGRAHFTTGYAGGGGGGTFIVNKTTGQPILVAGGGGGAAQGSTSFNSTQPGVNATDYSVTSGANGTGFSGSWSVVGTGGTNGSGGTNSNGYGGSGGSGYNGNGSSVYYGGYPGTSFTNGGTGGQNRMWYGSFTLNVEGGFGGGAGAGVHQSYEANAGGGGGYSGGGGGNTRVGAGGGGGNFVSGNYISSDLNTGNGYATIAVAQLEASITVTPWRMNRGGGAINYYIGSGSLGNPAAYSQMNIPATSDANWTAAPLNAQGAINFSETSILSTCRYQLDFTYFETYIDIPEGTVVDELIVSFQQVDDGARAYIFNSAHPNGAFDGEITINNGVPVSKDYSQFAVAGERNRIVIVQFDSCPVGNNLINAQVEINGSPAPVDNTSPPVVITQDITVALGNDGTFTLDPSQVDNGSFSTLAGPVTLSLDQNYSFSCGDYGTTTTVTLTATDTNGEQSSATANVTVNGGLDTDLDGVPNSCDLDDDNDGILDIDECTGSSDFYWSNAPSVTGTYTAEGTINNIGYTYTSSKQVRTTASIAGYQVFPTEYGIPNQTVIQNLEISSNTLTFDEPMTNPVLVFASIGASSIEVSIQFYDDFTIVWGEDYRNGINNPIDIPTDKVNKTITGREGYAIVRFNGTFDEIKFDYLANENYVNFAFGADFAQPCTQDDDNDGIINSLDLDSDGDGCSDAVEGSLGLGLDAINNDGSLSGSVDANGIPTSVSGGQGVGTSLNASATCVCDLGLDTTAPTITLNGGDVSLNQFETYTEQGATASDNCSATVQITGTVDTSQIGTYVLSYVAVDAQGNESQAVTRTVTVIDVTPPTIVTQDITVTLNDNGSIDITPEQINNGSSDPSGVASLALDITSFSCSDIGTNTVTLTVTDGNGNEGTATANVTVLGGLDTDSDGIPNACDLDDDNDGILDALECNSETFYWSNAPVLQQPISGGKSNSARGTINGIGYTYTSNVAFDLTSNVFQVAQKFPSSYGIPDQASVRNEKASENTLTFDQPMTNPVLVFASIGGGPTVTIQFEDDFTVLYAEANTTSYDLNAKTVTGKEGNAIIRFNGTFSELNFDYLNDEFYVNFAFGATLIGPCVADLDNDGIINSLDLDSDGDGCSDSVEGSLGLDYDFVNADGSLSATVDANGVPVSVNGGQGIGTSLNASATCECDLGIEQNGPQLTVQDITVNLDASGSAIVSSNDLIVSITDDCGVAGTSVSPAVFGCADVGVQTVTVTATDVNGNATSVTAQVTVTSNSVVSEFNQNDYVNNGNSSHLGNGDYRLTPNAGGQFGSVWYQNKMDLSSDFNLEFDVYLGNNDGGADGMAFVLQPLSTGEGTGGGGIGYLGISPSLAVEFDTYQNGDRSDPSADHLSLQSNGVINHYTANNLQGPVSVSNLENGQWHSVNITWNSQTNNFRLDLDGVNRINYTGDVVNNIFNGNPGVYWGWTAATGGATNEQRVRINSLIFTEEFAIASSQVVDASCPANADGSINIEMSYESPCTTYAWSNGATTQDISGLLPGEYSVTVSNPGQADVVQTFTVENGDTQAPQITAPSDISILATSASGAVVNYTAPVGTDNCTVNTALTAGLASGSTFPIGTTLVTYTATDASGLTASASFTVTVTGLPPQIEVPADITVENDFGICGATVSFAATETVGIPASTITYDIAPGSLFGVGTTVVTATATNAVGSSTKSFSITVNDTQAPTITSPFDITVNVDQGVCGAVVNYGVPTANDNCGTGAAPTTLAGHTYKGERNGHTYFLSNVKATPEAAHANAIAAGGHLATISDAAENSFISGFIADFMWIGATDRDVEGQWGWITNEPYTYTNWANGEPNNAGAGEDWAVINWGGVNNPSWNDWYYTQPAYYVIEFDGGTLPTTLIAGLAPGEVFPVGTTTVTYEAVDPSGNRVETSFDVTVIDNVAPQVLTNSITVQLDDNGNAGITVGDIDAGSNDACGIASYVLSKTSFDCSNVGANTVTLTVTDNNGNVSTGSAIVTVEDNVAPVFGTRESFILNLDENGSATLSTSDYNLDTIIESCGLDRIEFSKDTWNCDEVGFHVIDVTAYDIHGNQTTAQADVEIRDVTAPTVITQNIIVDLDANGYAAITPEMVDNGTYDNCSFTLSLNITEFSCAQVGDNVVELTAHDQNGVFASGYATVTVRDVIAAEVLTQNITVDLDASGNASITTGMIDAGSNDACGIASYGLDKTTFDCSNVGPNTVTLTVTDNNGNVSSNTAVVTVRDVTAAEVLTQNITIELDANGSASITTSDIDNGSNDACGIASYELSQYDFDCSHTGDNTVTLTVTDVNGNVSSNTAIVTVIDVIAPTVITKDIEVFLDENGAASITTASVDNGSFDNCSFTLSLDNSSFDCSNVGANTVTLTATDASGNSTSATATVTVTDAILPTVVPENINVYLDEYGNTSITVADVDGGTFDNCGIASLTIDINSFDCADLGENNVTLTATDVNGNVNTGVAVVTVIDNIAPTVGVQGITVSLDENGQASFTAEDVLIYTEDDIERDTECDVTDGEDFGMFLKKYVQGEATDGNIMGMNNGNSLNNNQGSSESLWGSWTNYWKGNNKGDDDDDHKGSKGDDDDDDGGKGKGKDKVKPKDTRFSFTSPGIITKSLDGTASVTGTLQSTTDATDQWTVTLILGQAYTWEEWHAMGKTYKGEWWQVRDSYRDWTYYDLQSGTLTGVGRNAGETVSISNGHKNFGFQLGEGANLDNSNYGMAGWFEYENRKGDEEDGYFSFDVDNCGLVAVPEGTVYTDDNCSIVATSVDVGDFTCTQLGENIVNVSVTDQSGNTTTVPITVTINDHIAPVAVATNITVSLGADGTVTVDPAMLDDGSTDNTDCPLTFSLSQSTFDCSDIGKGSYYYDDHDCDDDTHKHKKGKGHYEYKGNGYGHRKGQKHKGHKVILTVTDAAGNSSSTEAYIEVVDDLAPTFDPTPVTLVVYNEVETYQVKVRNGRKWEYETRTKVEEHYEYLKEEDVAPMVTDNCGLKDIDFSKTKYGVVDAGINQVTVSARDYSGNSSTGTVNVHVIDITDLGKYVDMCYEGRSIRVKQDKVQDMIRRGASLGDCNSGNVMSSSDYSLGEPTKQDLFIPELALEAYPNPTTGMTIIKISSNISGPARVALLSTSGVEMEEIYNNELEANTEVEVGYDASAMPSGVYIVRLVTAGEVRNLKLMVKK